MYLYTYRCVTTIDWSATRSHRLNGGLPGLSLLIDGRQFGPGPGGGGTLALDGQVALQHGHADAEVQRGEQQRADGEVVCPG